MQNSMVKFTFSVFDWKSSFWVNLVQKVEIITLSWNFVGSLIQICRLQWCCSLFCFWPEIAFLRKLDPKNENCQFKLKFGTKANSNMHNSILLSTFSVFDCKFPLLANLVQKVKIVSLSWSLVASLIRIFRIQWCCSLFLFSTRTPFLHKFRPENENYQFMLKFGT